MGYCPFGGLLVCRRTFTVSAVAPLAAAVLETCHQPIGRSELVALLAVSQEAERTEVDAAVGVFLDRMVKSGVLLVDKGDGT